MALRRTAALIAAPMLVLASLTLMAPAAQAAAPNDDVGSAQVVDGTLPVTGVTGDTADATAQSGETLGDGSPAGGSVWYAWTPAGNGPVEVSLEGSDFDTFLTAYTGPASSPTLADLTMVGYNDDASDLTSAVDFNAATGTTYYFQVDGCCGEPPHDSGSVDLSVSAIDAGITGTVTTGGAPAVGVCVEADGENQHVGMTDSTGTYLLAASPGTYSVSFSDCDSGANVLGADFDGSVDVTDGALAHADITLQPGGVITGTVTGPGGGVPADVCVEAESDGYSGYTETTNGSYRLEGLETGDYTIEFEDCSDDGTLAPVFYGGATSWDQAATVSVTAGSTVSGKNLQMATGASVSGTVAVPDGESGNDIRIALEGIDVDGDAAIEADDDGTFTLSGLATGHYELSFYDDHTDQHLYYNSTTTEDDATPVALTTGCTYVGANADFGTSVTGTPAQQSCANGGGDTGHTGPSAACAGAQVTAQTAAAALGHANGKMHSDQGKLKKLGKKVKKAKGHAKSKLKKKQKKLRKTVKSDRRTVSTATRGVSNAGAAVSAACR